MKYLMELQSERGGKCQKEVLDEATAGDNVRQLCTIRLALCMLDNLNDIFMFVRLW